MYSEGDGEASGLLQAVTSGQHAEAHRRAHDHRSRGHAKGDRSSPTSREEHHRYREEERAHVPPRSRGKRSVAEAATAYLRSGGEVNPGPGPERKLKISRSSSSSDQKVTQAEKAARRALKHGQHSSEAIVAQVMEKEIQQHQGEADAIKAVQEAEGRERKGELLKWQAAQAREQENMEDGVRECMDSLILDQVRVGEHLGKPCFWFHPLRSTEGFLAQFAEVGQFPTDLTLFPVPHRVAQAIYTGLKVFDTAHVEVEFQDVDGDPEMVAARLARADKNVPQLEREMVDYMVKRESVTLQFHVIVYAYGFGGAQLETYDEEDVLVPYEQWCAWRAVHSATFDMSTALPAVRAFRARNTQFRIPSLDPRTNSELADNVFAALGLLRGTVLAQGSSLFGSLLGREVTAAVVRAGGYSLAEGTYARPYDVTFAQLWPDQWKASLSEALDRKWTPAQAAQNFLGKIQDARARVYAKATTSLKQLFSARRAPVALEGVIPNVSGCSTDEAVAAAAAKRLATKLPQAHPMKGVVVDGAVDGLIEYLEERVKTAELTATRRMEEVVKHAEEAFTSLSDRTDYVGGAEEAQRHEAAINSLLDERGLPLPGVRARLVELRDEIYRRTAEFACFQKAEEYPTGAEKAPRWIVAPALAVRGYMSYIYGGVCRTFVRAMEGLTVKGLTDPEQIEMMDAASGRLGAEAGEQDMSSWESQNTAELRSAAETRVFEHLARKRSFAGAWLLSTFSDGLCRDGWLLANRYVTMLLSSMRRSGEYTTSVGNFISSVAVTAGTLGVSGGRGFAAPAEPVDLSTATEGQVRAAAYAGTLALLRDKAGIFEGDDAVFVAAHEVLETTERNYVVLGYLAKLKRSASIQLSSFCRKHLMFLSTGPVNFPSVPEVLAKLCFWDQPDTSSNHHDRVLQYAKAMSYHLMYGHVPLVGDLTQRIFSTLGDCRAEMLRVLQDASRRDALAVEIREVWRRHYRDFTASSGELAERVRHLKVSGPRVLSDEDVHRLREATGAQFQVAAERVAQWQARIRTAVSDVFQVDDDGTFARFYAQAAGTRRIVLEELGSARDAARSLMQKAAAKAEAGKVLASAGWATTQTRVAQMWAMLAAGAVLTGTVAVQYWTWIWMGSLWVTMFAPVIVAIVSLGGVALGALWVRYALGVPAGAVRAAFRTAAWIATLAVGGGICVGCLRFYRFVIKTLRTSNDLAGLLQAWGVDRLHAAYLGMKSAMALGRFQQQMTGAATTVRTATRGLFS